MKSLLGDLREKNLINEELKEKLEFYSDLQIDLMAKQGHEYTKDYREFALTLHLHGPKAYKYLRETRHFPLPHPHTIQRPGLNKMMLDMLERRCQGDPAKYGCVSLMLDAMSIRKHVQYNPHTQSMSGFVDMGDGNSETDVATEALVFMVVGLQGHWKAPIAYFLTKSLSPETQRVLLSHALEELHARGIRVVCVTMDGHASNVSMCNQLGCELKGDPREPLQTSFSHSVTGEKVFVMMDACHMLKLARNMLQVNNDRCRPICTSYASAAVEMSSAETAEEHPSPFANISALVCDHSHLPTRFGGLVENALVYIAGFVVRPILRKLSCDVCRASLVRDARPASFDKS
ncbi:hypothetical protein PO909_029667 [Leuciscus waleckii]